MGTEVKYFHSGMVGAPVVSGTAGALLSLLDAVLVDGFDTKAVVSGAIVSGVATLNFSGSHSSEVDTVILVAGATPSGLNGEQRVTAKSGTSVSFATGLADGSITGSVTIKMAPLGWTKPYTGTNKRVYKPSDVAATGCCLRVDDGEALTGRLLGYESMSDVDTGVGQFPTNTWLSGVGLPISSAASSGVVWPRSSAAGASARPWYVWGDSRGFYYYNAPNASFPAHGVIYGFGDFKPFKSGDAWACHLAGSQSGSIVSTTNANILSHELGIAQGTVYASSNWIPRSYTGVGGAVDCLQTSAFAIGLGNSGSASYNGRLYPYPNGPDNSLILSEVIWHQVPGTVFRGILPGIYHSPQTGFTFTSGEKLDGSGVYAGKKLMTARTGQTGGAGWGIVFMDITGPWSR